MRKEFVQVKEKYSTGMVTTIKVVGVKTRKMEKDSIDLQMEIISLDILKMVFRTDMGHIKNTTVKITEVIM